jgi:hypothetical protein
MLSAGIDEISDVGWIYLSRERLDSSLPWSRFTNSISTGGCRDEWWFSSKAELEEEILLSSGSIRDLCFEGELNEMRRE